MQLSTQAGSTTTNWMADVPGYYCLVWFHPGGIANILSMVNMIAKYHVTFDSHGGDHPNQFCVHKEDGEIRKFQQSPHTVLAISTVETNKSKYTDRDYSRAQLARKIQVLVGRPKLKDFLRYLDSNSIPNCPIQRHDAINAHAIFGREVKLLKGKITRQQLQAVLGSVTNNIPKEIMEQCRDITLCIDIMFVNRIPFFLSISWKVRFITAEVLDNCKEGSLIKTLQRIYGVYCKRGFQITNILGNSKFQCTCVAVATHLHSELNICGEDEHVPNLNSASVPPKSGPVARIIPPLSSTTHLHGH
jgi:hypothetical protein